LLLHSWLFFSGRDLYFISLQEVLLNLRVKQGTFTTFKLDSVFDFSDTKIFVSVRTFLSKLWFKDEKKPAIYFVRKSAHFGLYLFLGIFCFTFGIMYSKKLLIGLLIGISLPALIASFDEYSQQFFQRGASLPFPKIGTVYVP